MSDPNAVTLHFGSRVLPARLTALEGNGGFLRAAFDTAQLDFTPGAGTDLVIEMHDGGRFTFVIVEPTGDDEFRLKLVGRA